VPRSRILFAFFTAKRKTRNLDIMALFRSSGVIGLGAACAAFTALSLPLAAAPVRSLRTEYLVNPLGIHETAPRFSWVINSNRRGERQTAYQVLVASSPEMLLKGKGDLWDSGKVISDNSTQVVYAGKALHSRENCFWTVRIWDGDSKPGPWAPVAHWSMGLMQRSDWAAQWIDAAPIFKTVEASPKVTIKKASYEATDGAGAKDVTAIIAAAAASGDFSVAVNNQTLGGDPAFQHRKQLKVEYELNGKPQTATVEENQSFSLAAGSRSIPYLRKAFTASKTIKSATLYATALGVYEFHINGKKVGDRYLAPEWTDYRKRIRYQAYDVTGLLAPGQNVIGALVGHGWFSGHLGNGGYQYYGKSPALFAQLEITYTDGSTERVATDTSWKEHAGPIQSSDFMLGETYDARAEIAGWDTAGQSDAGWSPVKLHVHPETEKVALSDIPLEPQISEPVHLLTQIKPRSVKETGKGHWTFDLGQNMVGVVRLKVAAPAGTTVTIRHAEMLNKDGTIYTTNLRGAPSIDHYTTRSATTEVWQPKFTFHGFRYVELTGLTSKPTLDSVTGLVLGSDTPQAGNFACSDPRINQLQSNIQWGQRGNYLSVPTDCPQRDERMGWMGDAEVFVRTATCNADVAAFFTKWLVDVDDAQTPEGAYSDISPSYGGGGTPAWADAGVICPWTIYEATGDKRILEKHLPNMTRWVEWCREHSTGLIRDKDRNGDYGDWLAIGSDTPKDLIGTAFFAYSTHLVALSYKAVGDAANAAKYSSLFDEIKAAYNAKYVKADGRITSNTQCAYAMALKFELLPDALRPVAAQYLQDDIKAKGNHLSTGFVGVSYLLPVLTKAGMVDTAYNLLMQDTFPSWLFSVKHGATTIWERWDGWTPEKGFQDPGMNSFNHYSLGSCGEWLFASAAGIDWDLKAPGYKHIVVKPQTRSPLTWVNAWHNSMYGRIETSWKRDGNALSLKVTVPANSSATVYVPAADAGKVTEGGVPAAHAKGVKYLRTEDGNAVFEIGAGSYSFETEG
jgi:Bacterial alpha-L-rhamnosidase 6 hairpin glycosidase domain/Alpha-L-rhamnosidase N-terminal domain/Bacterial alpha-L-rhamnosidase concanavalin-like domain/Bacterial alpha-L-rhamnosidase C-terminal domain